MKKYWKMGKKVEDFFVNQVIGKLFQYDTSIDIFS